MTDECGSLPALVFETLCAAPEVETLQELVDLFSPALSAVGFTHFSSVELSSLPRHRSLTLLFGRSDPEWARAYAEEGLASVDPRTRHMLGSAEPALLSSLQRDAPSDRDFLARFHSHGHADSFVWPIHLPEGRVRGVLLLSDRRDLHGQAWVAAGALASGFHNAGAKLLRRLKAATGHEVELRPRQLECLYWARQGKSSADIGVILGISARTVDEHIAHACRVLGVRTRIQAVARAVVLGLF